MEPKPEPTLITILKPIIQVNSFFGVCPHEISKEGILIFRWKSFKFLHTITTLIILSLYLIYLMMQFVLSFPRNRGMPDKVFLALWIGGSLVTISMLIGTIIKRNKITLFFVKMREYKVPLKGMINCEKTLKYSRRLYAFYILLCFLSCCFITNFLIRTPRMDISILALFSEEPSPTMVAIACCFQCYIIIIKSCAMVLIEVLCSSLATNFVNTVTIIKIELEKSLDGSPRSQRPFALPSNQNRVDGISGKNMEDHPHIRKINGDNQNPQRGELYPVIPIVETGENCNDDLSFSLKPYTNSSSDGYGNYYTECVTEGTGPILLAIKRFNCMTNMQRLVNCIFGTMLAIDSAFLVFVSCLLLFLQINYLGSSYVDKLDGVIFLGHTIIFFARLTILFITLGGVYDVSLCFNGMLTSALMQIKKPRAMDVNLILAHLATNGTYPVAYSAGGFFTFSKSSLLAVFSGIMTYVVFLLQAKN